MTSLETISDSGIQLVVGISDAKFSTDPSSTLITYALGSCLGLTVYDEVKRLGGMLHCLLPLSTTAPDKANLNPFMFVDTGVTSFLNEFFSRGGEKSRLIVKVAGCGTMQDKAGQFNIGHRNYTVLRKILWKNDILIAAEIVSGDNAKTMSLDIATGRVTVKVNGEVKEI